MSAVTDLRPRRPDALRAVSHPLRWLALGLIAVAVVTGYGLFAAHSRAVTAAELSVDEALSTAHTSAFDAIALVIDWLFAPPEAVLITALGAVGIVVVTRSVLRGATFAGIVIVGWGSSEILKLTLQRTRPDAALLAHPLLTEHSFSYPSGHTCFVAALTVACVVTAQNQVVRRILAIAGLALTLIVGLSRVYLGVHYPSDVLAATVLGFGAASIAAVVWVSFALVHLRARLRSRAWWSVIDPTAPASGYAERREAADGERADTVADRG